MEEISVFFEKSKGLIGFITSVGLFIVGFILNYRARRIQSLMVFKEFREPLIKFANDTIDVISELEGLCECNPKILEQDFFNKYNSLFTKVSSLRDKGRLIIPNNFPEKYGSYKAEAYQGFRHEVLDCLTAAYYLAASINFSSEGHNKQPIKIKPDELLLLQKFDSKSDEFKSLKQIEKIKQGLDKLPDDYPFDGYKGIGWSSKTAIIETKRQFVSKIQEVIQTRSYGQKLIQLSEQKA
ncbi:MAG: hypothetical protein QM535_22235 [Limnohabitans sp.]|nr:hypothetical protein [Limnohabitans sp.]